MYKRIYEEIRNRKNERQVKRSFAKFDSKNDGTLSVIEMKGALTEILTTIDEFSLEKFIKFLDKDSRGRIDYTQFLNKMNIVSNKNHNPFSQVVHRIKYFMKQNNLSQKELIKRLIVSEGKEQGYQSEDQSISVEFFGDFMKSKIDKKREMSEIQRFAAMMDIDRDGRINIHDFNTCLGNL